MRLGDRSRLLVFWHKALGPMMPMRMRAEAVRAPSKAFILCSIRLPDKDLRDYNPDRPSKITSPFTIDAGRIDVESDFVSYLRSNVQGVTDRSLQYLDPTIKLGVLPNVDLEMTLNGDEYVRVTKDTGPRSVRGLNGFGDVFFRAKVNLLGDDGGNVALAFLPDIKLPANDAASLALGDGAVEGGGILTSQIKLPVWQATLQSQTTSQIMSPVLAAAHALLEWQDHKQFEYGDWLGREASRSSNKPLPVASSSPSVVPSASLSSGALRPTTGCSLPRS